MKKLNKEDVVEFRKAVYGFFRHGKRDFPWRHATDPYRILVSEIMLQQTQAPRVVEKYAVFIKRFPTAATLAIAPARNVLKVWSGLGYNRRAVMLQRASRVIVHDYRGIVPRQFNELKKLPGVGEYTAKAVLVFAFNHPEVLIETNVRSVFIHHFFPSRKKVTDASLLPFITQTLDVKNPRQWYSALMDYGTHLKKIHNNPSRRSKHHVKQKAFVGSDREIRGAIIKQLTSKPLTKNQLAKLLPFSITRITKNLVSLVHDELISYSGNKYRI